MKQFIAKLRCERRYGASFFTLAPSPNMSDVKKKMEELGINIEELSNPYQVIPKGITFQEIDKYIEETGTHAVSKTDQRRLSAALAQACYDELRSGSTLWQTDHPKRYANTIRRKASSILFSRTTHDRESIQRLFDFKSYGDKNIPILKDEYFYSSLSLVEDYMKEYGRKVFQVRHNDNGTIYLNYLPSYWSEWQIADRLWAIQDTPSSLQRIEENDIANIVDSFPVTTEQKESVKDIFQKKVSIVTGGAGTGKTEVILMMIEALRTLSPDSIIRITAPTGRAVQNLKERADRATIYPLTKAYIEEYGVSTNHKMLRMIPKQQSSIGKTPYSYKKNPLDVDVLIIDEMSMVDVYMTRAMLWSVPNHCHVVFVGDSNQLSSVGPGNVLHDLTYRLKQQQEKHHFSFHVHWRELTQIQRQKETSMIPHFANALLHAKEERVQFWKNFYESIEKEDILFVETSGETETLDRLLHYAEKYQDSLILTPRHQGVLGREVLNKKRHEQLFGTADAWVTGTPVIQNINNYEDYVMNGELGVIKKSSKNLLEAEFSLDRTVTLSRKEVEDQWLQGYASTVHKAQGIEADTVIVPLWRYNNENVWNIRLLYTAITRAKHKIILIGNEDMLTEAIERREKWRRTALSIRILGKAMQVQQDKDEGAVF